MYKVILNRLSAVNRVWLVVSRSLVVFEMFAGRLCISDLD